mgnify:FL=1
MVTGAEIDEVSPLPQMSSNIITSVNPAFFQNSHQNFISSNPEPVITPSTSNVINLPESIRLKIIPPNKSIFISRFAFDTSTADIDNYIKSNINIKAENFISIKKFTYSEQRNVTSFKLTVSFDLYDKLIDPSFWPDYTFVREYIIKDNPRRNNIVRLPSSLNSNSNPKN